mgnify:CR=1 FL=1
MGPGGWLAIGKISPTDGDERLGSASHKDVAASELCGLNGHAAQCPSVIAPYGLRAEPLWIICFPGRLVERCVRLLLPIPELLPTLYLNGHLQ